MLFNSSEFLVFFTIVLFIYFSMPSRYRWMLLLPASYYFYMSVKVEYGILLFISTVIGYVAAIGVAKRKGKRRKAWLVLGIAGNLGILALFKYANFIGDNISSLFKVFGISFSPLAVSLILPVGISFYTFQNISYLVDVYRRTLPPERHFGIYSVYHAFFPQLVAGPIERGKELLPQFYEKKKLEYANVIAGLKWMAWGYFKKLVIADRAAIVVNQVYGNPHDFTGASLAFATVLFAIQIYCDFSGYCDIAIGVARIMGFRLNQNFNNPYVAESVSEFWRRWHITLSKWFRDYVYIPLGGNRKGALRTHVNVMIVFGASGLWHGASWTFVIWGLLHGSFIVLTEMTRKVRLAWGEFLGFTNAAFSRMMSMAVTFLAVCIAWVFFRAASVGEAWYVLSNIPRGLLDARVEFSGFAQIDLLIICAALVILLFHEFEERRSPLIVALRSQPLAQGIVYCLVLLFILLFGVFGSAKFIYFQF